MKLVIGALAVSAVSIVSASTDNIHTALTASVPTVGGDGKTKLTCTDADDREDATVLRTKCRREKHHASTSAMAASEPTADRWSARPAWLHNDVLGQGGVGARARARVGVPWNGRSHATGDRSGGIGSHSRSSITPAVPPRGISCITWLDHTGPLGHVPFRPGSSSLPGVRQLGWRSYLCLGAITAWKPKPGAPRPISERRGALQEDHQQSASRPQAMPAVPRSSALHVHDHWLAPRPNLLTPLTWTTWTRSRKTTSLCVSELSRHRSS